MAVSVFMPNEDLVGEDLSTITRLLEATKLRETANTKDEELHADAAGAGDALMKHAGVSVDGLKALKSLAEKYKKAGEEQKMDPFPNVKSVELIKLISRIDGYLEQSAREDKNGGKKQVHPAANPVGKEPKKKEGSDVVAQQVEIVATPESRKKEEAKKK